jgi:hypothetical protein
MNVLKLFLPLLVTLVGCNTNSEPSNDDDDGGPPPPVSCDGYLEVEPNGEYEQAQFITILPEYSPDPICGEYVGVWEDVDFYKFWLQPNNIETPIIEMNLVLTTESDIIPYVSFYQSELDEMGIPTGDYGWIGTFFGEEGYLEVLDFPVPYVWASKMDLIIKVGHLTPLPITVAPYKLSFWN